MPPAHNNHHAERHLFMLRWTNQMEHLCRSAIMLWDAKLQPFLSICFYLCFFKFFNFFFVSVSIVLFVSCCCLNVCVHFAQESNWFHSLNIGQTFDTHSDLTFYIHTMYFNLSQICIENMIYLSACHKKSNRRFFLSFG